MFALMYIVQAWCIGTRLIYCVIVLLNHVLHSPLNSFGYWTLNKYYYYYYYYCIPLTCPGTGTGCGVNWVNITKELSMMS